MCRRHGISETTFYRWKAKFGGLAVSDTKRAPPAAQAVVSPTGEQIAQPGEIRDGGSYWERMGSVAVWNTVMDEDRYMVRKWNEFVAA